MNEPSTPAQTAAQLSALSAPELLNLLADGAYITDLNRQILFWNRAAERITGWSAEAVVGRSCRDNILVHVNKDGRPLCGHEHCPLHRSMVTGQPSSGSLVIYARHQSGTRIPVEVTVAPIFNQAGEVIGGVELFRDLAASMQDQLRAKQIQEMAVACDLPSDRRVLFETRYQPCDLVGGDFYRIERLDASHYAILVADAIGHGVSAALYTMLLRSLWDQHRHELASPARFLEAVNRRVAALVHDDGFFGTAVCVNYELNTGLLHCVRAGHPPPLLFRAGGAVEPIGCADPALAMFPEIEFQETVTRLDPGDALLLFTDGATEIFDAENHQLGPEGLIRLVREQPAGVGLSLAKLEEQLLRYCNQIHLPDDLTLIQLLRRH